MLASVGLGTRVPGPAAAVGSPSAMSGAIDCLDAPTWRQPRKQVVLSQAERQRRVALLRDVAAINCHDLHLSMGLLEIAVGRSNMQMVAA